MPKNICEKKNISGFLLVKMKIRGIFHLNFNISILPMTRLRFKITISNSKHRNKKFRFYNCISCCADRCSYCSHNMNCSLFARFELFVVRTVRYFRNKLLFAVRTVRTSEHVCSQFGGPCRAVKLQTKSSFRKHFIAPKVLS